MGAVDVSTGIVIERPLDVVGDFVMNPENAPLWYRNIKSVEWVTSPPLEVGSHVAFVAHFLGRRLAYTYEVVTLEPRERLVMRTAEGPFPMETSYTLEADGPERTRMVLRNRGAPAGFARVTAPVMAWAMRRENRKDLRTLKSILETGHPRPR